LLSHSILPKYRTALAGGAASVLAAIAIAAPAGAAETTPTATGFSWGYEAAALNFTQPGQDLAFHFTRPGG
jgi:hypothetical protein